MEEYDSPSLRAAIAECFSVVPEQLELIRAYGNLVYDGGNQIIRLTHSSLRPESNIIAELHWLAALGQAGLPVVHILASTAANKWERLPGSAADYFTAVSFEKLAGERIAKQEWIPAHFTRLGELTAQLHLHSLSFQPAPTVTYPQWNEIIEHFSYQYALEDRAEINWLFTRLMERFAGYAQTTENYGLIHYDIHHGNYFAQLDKIVLFDFEMVCYGWYMHDVATVLYYACLHPASRKIVDFEATFLHYFWQGYERHHLLPREDRTMIPFYLLYRDILVYGYLGKIWEDKPLSKGDAAYLKRLRQSIQRRKTVIKA